jgi:soluble lytic murein transglycosylase-like protein
MTRSTRGPEPTRCGTAALTGLPLPVLVVLLLLLAVAAPAAARLAVFVDGRILRVEDAVLEGQSIVLSLPDGGTLTVAATRIDRVVADEAPPAAGSKPDGERLDPGLGCACDPGWVDLPLPVATPFRDQIRDAAQRADLHPWLLASLVQAESAYDPRALSRAGAAGLTQLMPAAAADHRVVDVWDPAENLRGGAEHLRSLLDRFQSLPLALAAYNAGAATVERAAGIPQYRETCRYVRTILSAFCPEDRGDVARRPASE